MYVKGKKVGKYELSKTLGTGAFSKVKLGVDDKGNQYAVKIVDKKQAIKSKLERQLMTEINVMKMFHHPFIVHLHDILQTTNNIYMVLELITGGELFGRIVTAKRFDEKIARKYFQQLIVAMEYCHSLGVSHRDLKPENLLIADNGDLKITDFGLAALSKGSEGNLLKTVCGTPNYVAPEVIKEKGYVGPCTDIWSAGVILFVMLVGYLPFDDASMTIVFRKIEAGEFIIPKFVSEEARDLIKGVLTTDPQKRSTIAQVIKHPWFVKDWDRRVYENMEAYKIKPVMSPLEQHRMKDQMYGRTEEEKETNMDVNTEERCVMGAFELIQNLSMVKLNDMASNRPVIKIFTRFILGCGYNEAQKEIISALMAIESSPRIKDSKTVKGFRNLPKGLLNFSVTCVVLVDPEMTMVEVRRGRGDIFDFHDLYRSLMKGLGKLVISIEMQKENQDELFNHNM